VSTEERVSYRDKLAEAVLVYFGHDRAGRNETSVRMANGIAEAVLAVITCGASNTGLIPDTTLGSCILRVDHEGPVHEDGNGVRWSLGESVRDPELDRLSQENDRLAAKVAKLDGLVDDCMNQMIENGVRAESAEAQLAEAQKKIVNLSARFTGVKIHALRLRDRITDPATATVLDELFGALTNPPPGDTPEPNRSGS
jgi:hypothetical protein